MKTSKLATSKADKVRLRIEKEQALPYKLAAHLLSYCPMSGRLYWKNPLTNRVRAGQQAGSYSNGYMQIRINNRTYGAHRVAWLLYYREWPGEEIDHADHDRSNNRVTNLRSVSLLQNRRNAALVKVSNTGELGIHKIKNRNLFQVPHRQEGNKRFPSLEEAKAYRAQLEKKYSFHENHGYLKEQKNG